MIITISIGTVFIRRHYGPQDIFHLVIGIFVAIFLRALHLLLLLVDQTVRIRIILVAHGDLYLLQDAEHILRLQQL